ncbi:T9SS type A sorting domain-containing protein [Flammeovirga aprica]|uniref:T9SS type A sorting domain-containing protein n=1 Tax=Flammeovirga aprica JL-4 TaxID=694437 RepID=A0A7X9S0I7_9BACT|nr:T9SS type A sorting domain-containing protein [Flammeovirga aprica]NME72212.1 T9SS type A sorting domain-containing protein [Flammeovirga aprica JL-4]
MKRVITLSLLLSLCLNLNAQVNPLSDPDNEGGWILNKWASDEFNGEELNKGKWWVLGENNDYRAKWKGRAPGQFAGHNVRVENGELILTSRWDPDYDYALETNNGCYYGGTTEGPDGSKPITQASVMSETFFRYGYMEIRCKAADAPVTSAFWTTGYHGEIDMIENYGRRPIGNPENQSDDLERRYRTNLISWDPDKDPDHKNWKVEDDMQVRMAEDYYVFGFEWDKEYMKTYFNGKLLRSVTKEELMAKNQWKYDYPHEIWLSSEVFYWYGLPNKEDLAEPAEFKVDYIRVWQKEEAQSFFNAKGFEGPFHFQGRSVQWWNAPSHPWRIRNEKAAEGEFSLKFEKEGDFDGNYSIFSPFGSLDLPSGDNEVSFQIWLDEQTEIDYINLTLFNPRKTIKVNTQNIPKGEWVTVSQTFNRTEISNPSFTEGDRIQLMLRGRDIKSAKALFYIDDIQFKNDNDEGPREYPYPDDVYTDIDDKDKEEPTGFIPSDKSIFNVYPNPAQNQLNIEGLGNGKVEVFSSQGALLHQSEKKTESHSISLENLKNGLYFVSVKMDDLMYRYKVVKQ